MKYARRAIRLLLLTLLPSLWASASWSLGPPSSAHAKVAPPVDWRSAGVVLIAELYDGDRLVARATGVPIIARGVVMMPASVLVSSQTLVALAEDSEAPLPLSEVLLIDEERGVAFVRVPGLMLAPVPLGELPRVGEDVVLVTAPLLGLGEVAGGYVIAPRPHAFAIEVAALPLADGALVINADGAPVAVARHPVVQGSLALVPLSSYRRVRFNDASARTLPSPRGPLPPSGAPVLFSQPRHAELLAKEEAEVMKLLAASSDEDEELRLLEARVEHPFAYFLWAKLARIRGQRGISQGAASAHAVAAALWTPHRMDNCALAALAHQKSGSAERAERIARRCLVTDPGHAMSTAALGSALAGSRRPVEALPLLRAALAEDHSLGWVHGVMAIALQESGMIDEAIVEFRIAIAKEPNARLYMLLGDALQSAGQEDEAVTAYRRALQSKEGAQGSDIAALAERFRGLGLPGDARDALRAAQALGSDQAKWRQEIKESSSQ